MIFATAIILLSVMACIILAADTAEARRAERQHAAIRYEADCARRRIDQAAYNAESEMRRLYTQQTGRLVPPPNPFRYEL